MRCSLRRFCVVASALLPLSAWAGTAVPFTINLSKPVNVVTSGGTPRIAVDVAGTTRYANYTSGSGTSALVFTYNMQAGDVDLDGVAVSSPVQLNGGTIKDLSGNPLTNLTFTPPNTAGIKVNYPSLGMDFTNGAGGRYTLNGTPYTTLASFLTAAGGSFTRASVGTYYDSAGVLQTASANTPRLDYDPVTHAAKGILIEESRTNLLQRSAEFENVYWTKQNTTITANAATAPDGTMTADMLVENAGLGNKEAYRSFPVTAGTTYAITVYAKANGRNVLRFNSGFGSSIFTLTGAGTAVVGGPDTAQIAAVGNGWYRLTVTHTYAVTGGDTFYITLMNGSANYTGDGTSGAYIWGAQVEVGAFATSYIPTTTAAVTRQADSLTIPVASIPSHNLTAGTWFSEYYTPPNGAAVYPFIVTYTPGSNEIITDRGGSVGTWNGTTQIDVNGNPSIRKFASAYDAGGRYLALNGVINSGSGTFNLSGTTTLNINGPGRKTDAPIKKLKYYPARVPNAQLQLMTQ